MEPIPQELDTARDLAKFLKLSLAAVRKWTRTTDIPHIKAGRAVRYDRAAVLNWLRARQSR
jgi:excisionase family DNA binding protein